MAWGLQRERPARPRHVGAGGHTHAQHAAPTPVLEGAGQPLSEVRSFAAASTHALALRANGEVVGWGDGEEGELGAAQKRNAPRQRAPNRGARQRQQKRGARQCVRFATRVIAPGGLRAGARRDHGNLGGRQVQPRPRQRRTGLQLGL